MISLILKDKRELNIPPIGLVNFVDNETGERRLIDTSDKTIQNILLENIKKQEFALKQMFRTSGIDSVYIDKENYLKSLIEFFKLREKRW